jgi:hypothetical protein
MSDIYGYVFNNMSRIGGDSCNKSQTDIQNTQACNYTTQNYFASNCSLAPQLQLATMQPGIMYSGGYNSGAGGCNINESSNLQIGTIQTHPKCRIDLFHRPFATVPYLGRGSVNPMIELQLKQGDTVINKKSINNLSEKSYIRYHQTPLLPAVEANLKDSSRKIESEASNGWVRGGIPSRELTKDVDYLNKHSTFQYV